MDSESISHLASPSHSSINKSEILEVIQKSQRALSVAEIRTFIRSNFGKVTPDYSLTRLLRSLSSDGLANYSQGKWSSCAGNIGRGGKTAWKERPAINIPLLSPFGQEALGSTSKRSTKIQGNKEANKSPTSVVDPTQPTFISPGPWTKFRNLVAYYKECIRNEEGAEASAYLNEYGNRYLYFSQLGEWYPKVSRNWIHTIPFGQHLSGFVKELEKAGDSTVVVLGYPLQCVYIKKENEPEVAIIRPVFQYILKANFSHGGLTFSTLSNRPELCLDWLKYAFSSHEQQRNFLSACGLINSSNDNDDVADYDQGHGVPDLRTLATTLSTFLSKKIKEPLQIDEISSEPLKTPFETGIYNKAVIMIGSRTRFTKKLLDELTAIEKTDDLILDTTALQYLFRDGTEENIAPSSEGKNHESCVFDTDLMNVDQRQAVAALMSRNLSVITGPPGTGKSQVVCSGIANARLANKTTIFASRNHKAIDAVVNRLRDKGDRPLIVRTNSKEDPNLRYTFSTAIKEILSANYDVIAKDRFEKISVNLNSLLEKRGKEADLAYAVQALRDELGEYEEQLAELADQIPNEVVNVLAEAYARFPVGSIRRLNQIVSLHDSNRDFHAILMRVLKSSYLTLTFPKWLYVRSKLNDYKHGLKLPILELIKNPASKKNLIKLLVLAADYADLKGKITPLVLQQKEYPNFESLTASIEAVSERIANLATDALALDLDRRNGLQPGTILREELASLKVALKAKRSGFVDEHDRKKISEIVSSITPILLGHFPSWAVTNLSIGSRLPLVPGMFDLAIIDEASQSDIPSAIPILFRAKRAAVVGDPNQLTHTSKISISKETLLRKRVGLSKFEDLKYSYTETSLYDLFAQASQIQPAFLSSTYRSADSIAQYSNSTFYSGKLNVATDSSRLKAPTGTPIGINWTHINGEVKSAGGGGCYCAEEVAAVVELIEKILKDINFQGTLGIVTPFRQQANRIQDAIYQYGLNFDELGRVRLHVDTSHGFQGDEKDVMIFSLCAGPNMPRGSREFLRETGNLFNVAVSRARAVLHVLGNLTWAESCGIKHIQNLARPPQQHSRPEEKGKWHPHESPWEEILYKALVEKGVVPIPQYPVTGRRLDMALVGNQNKSRKIDIEVDGDRYHRNRDGSRKKDDVWRDIQLHGMGWIVMRFWVYQLREDLNGCVEKIVTTWSEK
ncbi:DUF559 domain-containing protein [Desulfopila sp. IMCC35006]|uniref:AAA domain-containing protein n=1 Tax=Desulfopila sp. IMCC35006 TaxID=2569542 RepID=UPI0010ACF7F7|nr:AAA domain-containing protein [Desulfopila sp. IMCC35006]TKB26500.1 DUF559 domain-containing protein [Desulfopila sp. IMCC35006]